MTYLPPDGKRPIDFVKEQYAFETYGLPPPPDANENPKSYALWRRAMCLPLDYCTEEPTDKKDDSVSLEKLSWSGAMAQSPANSSFGNIAGSWIVPNAYPPPKITRDDTYECFTWVGFDGTSTAPYAIMLGTISEVVKSGKTLTQSATVFFQQNDKMQLFPKFKVSPGDLITGHVWRGLMIVFEDKEDSFPPRPIPPFKFPPRHRFKFIPVLRICVVNHGSRKALIRCFKLPDDFKGDTAEWIVGRKRPIVTVADDGDITVTVEDLPNYGATFIHNTYALTRGGGTVEEFTVDDSVLINMKNPDKDGTIVSTALRPISNVLEVYAYDDES